MSKHSDRRPTRRGFIFGAIVVGILAVITAVLIVSSLVGGGDEPDTSSTPLPSTPTSASLPAIATSVCGLNTVATTETLTAAPATNWVIVGTMAAPESVGIGPGSISADGFRSCYARTPKGVLFAAANVLAMGTDATLSSQIAELLVVSGPGRDAALATATDEGANGLSAQIAGFKILSYGATDATVDLAFQLNTGELVSFPQRFQWSEGDWKIVLADDGGPAIRPSTLQSLGGYLPWKGVG